MANWSANHYEISGSAKDIARAAAYLGLMAEIDEAGRLAFVVNGRWDATEYGVGDDLAARFPALSITCAYAPEEANFQIHELVAWERGRRLFTADFASDWEGMVLDLTAPHCDCTVRLLRSTPASAMACRHFGMRQQNQALLARGAQASRWFVVERHDDQTVAFRLPTSGESAGEAVIVDHEAHVARLYSGVDPWGLYRDVQGVSGDGFLALLTGLAAEVSSEVQDEKSLALITI
ncbi:hypothetical protein AA23498_3599 [Acetobacter nitrogenifigens DSM 23921 = NBRC 105050]|uniref:Uncharacterized protein n=1 Tax=Acetobacter nitrogenifigens DSM 23921 = NBRC 105050 TaxID=1120919 RepID=A0A511XFF3_9PROT|nr:hypothetical protein [Acetobacter nitrogenifigens]GBR00024.1 hypothetical protein AA23498_3599 [Acetobacter nitrogenifigens DSM 23921 = NBRC 105050]GEN61674.1 hypothetical protein ANI02nite_35580 [Acetobacter nitrogenifigens DSM 23921 = NBRC 105050]